MNKTKLFGYIAAGLLVFNLCLLAFIFLKRPGPHEGPRDIIIERLHFDGKQIEEYDKLIIQHRKDMLERQSQMLALKNKLYGNLTSGSDSATINSIETEIGNLQIDIEKINYSHFEDIEKLCQPNQKTYFDDLIKDIARLFNRHKPGEEKK